MQQQQDIKENLKDSLQDKKGEDQNIYKNWLKLLTPTMRSSATESEHLTARGERKNGTMKDTREYYCKDEKTAREICTIAELNGIKAYINGHGHIVKLEKAIKGLSYEQFSNYVNCIQTISEYIA